MTRPPSCIVPANTACVPTSTVMMTPSVPIKYIDGLYMCPNFHHYQRGAAQVVTDAIEPPVLAVFTGKASDLSNAGQIIVQQRVHGGGGPPLQSIAPVRGRACTRGRRLLEMARG